MNGTLINARNWEERRNFVSFYVVKWVYHYMLGLGLLKQVEKRAVYGAVSQR